MTRENDDEVTSIKVERVEPPMKVTSVSIGVASKCPTCGELPTDFRPEFERRVAMRWIVPAKGEHLTGDGQGGFREYHPGPENVSPAGLYPAVIVPDYYRGKIIEIRGKGET